MPRTRKNTKKNIETYICTDKERVNNPLASAKIVPRTIRIQNRINL